MTFALMKGWLTVLLLRLFLLPWALADEVQLEGEERLLRYLEEVLLEKERGGGKGVVLALFK